VSDTIKILKQRISDRIRASDERRIACQELLQQATDLVAMSRDPIARSREKVARLEFIAAVVPPARPFTDARSSDKEIGSIRR
jgi:hypothetical protein